MKEHEIRELVNRLRDIAIKYHNTQQLRERIAHAVNSAIKPGTLTNEGTIQSGNSGQVPDEKLPLNYLQGQKDGLEWAAQMAEASHPQTGDWLYDDPLELAKAIRKGPDMSPVQPVPVVSADLLHAAASAIEDLLTTKDRTGAGVWFDLPFKLRSAANAQPAPVVPKVTP